MVGFTLLRPARAEIVRVISRRHVRHALDSVLATHRLAVFARDGDDHVEASADVSLKTKRLAPLAVEVSLLQWVRLNFVVAFPDHRLDVVLKEHGRRADLRGHVDARHEEVADYNVERAA